MTSFWGPLGWLTLHSASLVYPDQPSDADFNIVSRYVTLFEETITCHTCRSHFHNFRKNYKAANPGYLSSKKEFVLFVMRAHNNVNKRIDKPVLKTFDDCLQTLKNAQTYSSFQTIRQSYLDYLQRNWGQEHTGDGFGRKRLTNEMAQLNEYFNRPIDWDIHYSDDVFTYSEQVPKHFIRRGAVGFKNGKLIL
jgi:hypothetical protein